ncbi:hypothetical protein C8T65DRAFT_669117 [Cerioporus squamosus]|nr:hypothetical protein C8T65DRAFT_669117 [Cerioporus squamosus]
MQLTSLLALFLAALAVRACPGEDHDHAHAHEHERRAYPQTRLTPPTRPLVWGDVNIIHTTDSHGWLLGHQKSSFPEPNYSHELYIYNNTYDMYKTFAPKLNGRYLSSNVNITVVDEHGKAVSVPVGGKYMHEAREGERAAVWRRWRCV